MEKEYRNFSEYGINACDMLVICADSKNQSNKYLEI